MAKFLKTDSDLAWHLADDVDLTELVQELLTAVSQKAPVAVRTDIGGTVIVNGAVVPMIEVYERDSSIGIQP
ncbi:MAG: hypothetical protein JWN87_3179 [Frankiales bacterium]|jgi:hypothetical protein|nr:hypothetical protein [Frankiales bacterium]MCW2587137.1 hypothetical protein [Frankiales bacterium]